jgi:hypothetical protein
MSKVLFALLFSFSTFAQMAELEISSDIPYFQEVEYLQISDFTVTITNNGPNTVGDNSPLYLPNYIELTEQQLNEDGSLDLELFHHPGVDPLCLIELRIEESPDPYIQNYIYVLNYPKLESGESVACFAQQVIRFKHGSRSFTWRIEDSLNATDPNLSNNFIEFSFGIKTQTIPSISTYGVILLAFLIVLIVFKKRPFVEKVINLLIVT